MLSHVHIGITNFEPAFAFYRGVMDELGFTLKFSEPEKSWAGWMQAGVDRPLFLIGYPYNGERAAPMERIWPAFQDIDTSSGALGTAVARTLAELIPIVIDAPADDATRSKWLERLFEAVQNDGVEYLAPVEDRWGEIGRYPDLINEYADRVIGMVRRAWADHAIFQHVIGTARRCIRLPNGGASASARRACGAPACRPGEHSHADQELTRRRMPCCLPRCSTFFARCRSGIPHRENTGVYDASQNRNSCSGFYTLRRFQHGVAALRVGSDGNGRDGIVGYFTWVAERDLTSFYVDLWS